MQHQDADIYELLMTRLNGSISKEDYDLVEQLIQHDAAVRELWEKISGAPETAKIQAFNNRIDEDQAWERVYGRLAHRGQATGGKMKRMRWRIAAAVILFAMAGTAWYLVEHRPAKTKMTARIRRPSMSGITLELANGRTVGLGKDSTIQIGAASLRTSGKAVCYTVTNSTAEEWSTLKVPSAADYRITLSDGTEVWLNAVSTLRFPFSFLGKSREVYLTGEAFFKVAKNSQRPFIVHTTQNNIEVTGTAFNVNTYSADETITSLVEGSVTARGAVRGDIHLEPGYQSTFKNGYSVSKEAFDETVTLAWMKGIHYFFDAPLANIAQVVPRWFSVPVVFDRPELANRHFTGAIEKNKPLDSFLEHLKLSADIEANLEDSVLHLR